MNKLKGSVRRIFGLQRTNDELPTTSQYRPVDRDEPKDSERLLLTSPSPSASGESDLTACEKMCDACDCGCHHQRRPPQQQRLTPARINLCASLFWLLGALVIFLVFRRASSNMPANGTFGWCERPLPLFLAKISWYLDDKIYSS